MNYKNVLGTGGKLATTYAHLLEMIWSGKYTSLQPRKIKAAIGKFAPQFTGYNQHDSQELLAFILDGLHEDLNRIIKKPYTETVEDKGRMDEVI